ncbi:hypothetical protein PINS_up014746 [Pythium insidiosum]|nr:hypothetical protein PINS_up014746 [Pythium insidiosum]
MKDEECRSPAGEREMQSFDLADDIASIRKFIVGVMQEEMELMENIKQREDTVSVVDARIQRYGDAIRSEAGKNNELRQHLVQFHNEILSIEDRRTVVDAKFKQLADAIAYQELELQSIMLDYQSLRQSLIHLARHSDTAAKHLDLVEEATQATRARLDHIEEQLRNVDAPEQLRTQLHKLVVKKSYVLQQTKEIFNEQGCVEHELLKKQELLESTQSANEALKAAIESLDDTTNKKVHTLRHEMTVLQERIERAEKKLKTKQKRFRTNKKAEITTLRKRVNFVTADMEIAFMSSEDVLSALFPMVDRQFELQTTQGLLKRQIVETEVACLIGWLNRMLMFLLPIRRQSSVMFPRTLSRLIPAFSLSTPMA